jgi:hypothetical protein
LERIANLIQRFDLDFKHVKSQSIKFLSTWIIGLQLFFEYNQYLIPCVNAED